MITKIIVSDSGRADKILASSLNDISRTQIKKSFEAQQVFCNGRAIKPKQPVKPGDVLEFKITYPESTKLKPHEATLEILFEDEDVIIINKPANIVVHTGNGIKSPTLVECVLSHCQLSPAGGELRPGVVHRLDKDTTGAIIFAKNDEIYLKLVKMFAARQIHKKYLAIACGAMQTLSGRIEQPIGRHRVLRTKMCVHPAGKPAVTDWELIENFGEKFCLLRITLHTGRTHQIRVHLSTVGHPLLGDITYGYKGNIFPGKAYTHPMLHAERLQFVHPKTQKDITVTAPLPGEFKKTLEALRNAYHSGSPRI